MKKLLLTGLTALASTAALAHTSSVPHGHPHEANILPDLSVMLVAVLIVACGVVAVRTFGRRP
jgi:hypothetical protein